MLAVPESTQAARTAATNLVHAQDCARFADYCAVRGFTLSDLDTVSGNLIGQFHAREEVSGMMPE